MIKVKDNSQWVEVTEIKDLFSFLKSIDFRDPWLIVLMGFHMIITTLTLMTRRNCNVQVFLFLVLISMVYFSESINEYAASHWSTFSRQQYFDSHGLFISVVFSVPILLNCMILVGSWLYQSTQLMAKLKTAQLKDQIRRQRASASGEATTTTTTAKKNE